MTAKQHDFRTIWARARRPFALACVLGLGLNAHAQYTPGSGSWTGSGVTQSQFRPNPGVLPGGGWQFTPGSTFGDPPPPRTWTNGVWGARVEDRYALMRSGVAVNATMASTATWRAAAAAIGRCVALVNPWCAGGTAAYILYRNYRIRGNGGDLFRDEGDNPPQQSSPYFYSPTYPYCTGGTLGGNCWVPQQRYSAPNDVGIAVGVERIRRGLSTFCELYQGGNPNIAVGFSTSVVMHCTGGTGGVSYPDIPVYRGADVVGPGSCPAYTDAFDPAFSRPAGDPGPDGKCPSGRYVGITPDSAGDLIAPPGTDLGSQGLQATQDAISSGQEIPATGQTSGPQSVTGSPTTTTTSGPNGTTSTTSTPTYTFNYGPTTITYGPTTTTTTTINNNGGTTTTTTTETTTPAQAEGDTQCDRFPNTVGCTPMGEAPDDAVPRGSHTLTFGAESVGLPSGCPVPHVIPDVGTVSYAQACDSATSMRPFIIATGMCAAALLVLAALREL